MNQDFSNRELLLVYNADSGLFNALADAAHKIWSPETYKCQLCALTYGAVAMREEWATFLRTLTLPVRFLHRDEFRKKFPDMKIELPAALLVDLSKAKIVLDSEAINQCSSLNELKEALRLAASETTG